MAPLLYRASRRYLLRHPWQLAMALAGIGIGVAVIVAVDLANRSAEKAFRLSMDTVNGKATHHVTGGPGGLDDTVYVRLRTRHGVTGIAPLVEGEAHLDGAPVTLLGVDLFAETELGRHTGIDAAANDAGDGPAVALLTTPGAVLLSRTQADDVVPGQPFDILANGRAHSARLAGYLPDRGAGANLVVTDIATAQSWLGMDGKLSRIDAVVAGTAAADAIRAALPPDAQWQAAASRSRSVIEMSRAFATNLTAMSLLALLVAVFIIYNSVSFTVLQRRHLLGVLRALGVTRGAAFRLIVAEAAVLGLVGSALGIATGVWLGEHLLALVSRSINDLYFRVNVTDVAVDALSLAKGLGAAVLATLVAAAVPAVEAAATRPRLAMLRSTLESRVRLLLPKTAAAGALIVLLSGTLLLLSGQSLVAGLTALFGLVLGAAFWIPAFVRFASGRLRPAAARLFGSTGRLAVSGVAVGLSRTGVAIVALAVAVSATVGVSVMVDSFRGSVSDWLSRSLSSDLYVSVAGGGDIDTALASTLAAVPGVADFSSSRRAWIDSGGEPLRLIALQRARQGAPGIELLDADIGEAWTAVDEQGAVLVSEPLAYRRGLSRGDALSLMTASGERQFRIAAVFRSYDANAGAVMLSRASYKQHWNDDGLDSLGLYLADDAVDDAVQARLHAAAGDRQSLVIRSNRELRDTSMQIFDRTFIITDVLYLLAVLVAVIGIFGAMTALQLERAGELGVLRALGLTPGQLGAMVTLQSGFIGALSGLAAVPLGLLMAWVLIDVINRRAFGWSMPVDVDVAVLWHSFALSVVAASVAGVYPAWSAARRRPAALLRED